MPARPSDAFLACPRDGRPLRKLMGAVVLDRCDCGGTWFDESELRRVARDDAIERVVARAAKGAAAGAVRCPRCGDACAAARVGGAEVDACPSCRGVWLDAHEFDRVRLEARAVRERGGAPGGLVALLFGL